MKKLAIFDFDGTLFDSIEDVLVCFNKALTIHDFPTLTRDELIPCLGGDIDKIVGLVLKDNNTPQNVEILKETYLNLHDSSKKEMTVPFPNAHDCLKKLQEKGVMLAINSNRLNYSLNELISKFFPDIDFLAIEGQLESSIPKPNPTGVERILKSVNVSADDAVYIGDSLPDILTAQNAGMDCILVSWGYAIKKDLKNDYPLEVIDDFDELLKYF